MVRIALWRKICEKIQIKIINNEHYELDYWGDRIKYPLKYSFKDIEYAVELTVKEMRKHSSNIGSGKK